MSVFRLSKAFGIGRVVKAFLDLQSSLTRDAIPEEKERLKCKNQKINQLEEELRIAKKKRRR